MEVIFTQENFEAEVVKADKLVMVDFYADWCGPCKMMAPVVEELANEMTDVKIGKLNVDNAPAIAQQYKVMNIPTILFIKNGEVVDKVVGAVPKATLEEKINANK